MDAHEYIFFVQNLNILCIFWLIGFVVWFWFGSGLTNPVLITFVVIRPGIRETLIIMCGPKLELTEVPMRRGLEPM